MLQIDRTHTIVSIHPVIREVCKNELRPDDENCKRFLHKLQNCVNVNSDNQELVKPVADTMSNAAEFLTDVAGEWSHLAGKYYRILGMYQKAVGYLNKASEIRKTYGDVILADIYSDIGNTYTNLKEFERSIDYQEKSLEICLNLPKRDGKRIARRYNDMGLAYSYRAEKERKDNLFEKAIECYKEAFKLANEQDLPNMLYVSNILNNIGNTYSNIGKTWRDSTKYQLALDYHMKALDIRKNIKNISQKSLARSYKNIGNDYANLKRDDKALEYRIKALNVYLTILHDGHPELAFAYQDVGNTYRLTGDYAKAIEHYIKAEDIWKKQLPQNYSDLAKCQYAIGICYSEKAVKEENEEHEKALRYYMEALECCGKNPRSQKREMVKYKDAIGETYVKLGRREKGLAYLKENDNIDFGQSKQGKLKQIKKYHYLGKICKKEKCFEDALNYYEKILEIRKNYFFDDFNNLLEINFEIGCIYREMRLPQKAMPYLMESLSICQKYFPENRKNLHRIRKTIEITNGELKKHENRIEKKEKKRME